MKSFSKDQISHYLKSLASSEPAPGGGSAACVVLALGSSLLGKVAAISATKSNDNSFQEEMRQADQAQAEAMQLADQDAQIYTQVVETYRLKAATDVEKKERRKKIDSALEKAFHVPLKTLQVLQRSEDLRQQLFKKASGSITGDLEVAGSFFDAVKKSSLDLAQGNIDYIKNEETKQKLKSELEKWK